MDIKIRFKGIKRVKMIITPYSKLKELDGYSIGEPLYFSFSNIEGEGEKVINLPPANKYEIYAEIETRKGEEIIKQTVIAHPEVKQNIRFLEQIGIVNKDVWEYARIELEGVAHVDYAEKYIGKSEIYRILNETF